MLVVLGRIELYKCKLSVSSLNWYMIVSPNTFASTIGDLVDTFCSRTGLNPKACLDCCVDSKKSIRELYATILWQLVCILDCNTAISYQRSSQLYNDSVLPKLSSLALHGSFSSRQETILTKGLPRKAPNGTGQLLPVDYTDPKVHTRPECFVAAFWRNEDEL